MKIRKDNTAFWYGIAIGDFSAKWAKRGTIWNYTGPAYTKYRWRQDHLFSLVRHYARGTGTYIYAMHLWRLKLSWMLPTDYSKMSIEYRS